MVVVEWSCYNDREDIKILFYGEKYDVATWTPQITDQHPLPLHPHLHLLTPQGL